MHIPLTHAEEIFTNICNIYTHTPPLKSSINRKALPLYHLFHSDINDHESIYQTASSFLSARKIIPFSSRERPYATPKVIFTIMAQKREKRSSLLLQAEDGTPIPQISESRLISCSFYLNITEPGHQLKCSIPH